MFNSRHLAENFCPKLIFKTKCSSHC